MALNTEYLEIGEEWTEVIVASKTMIQRKSGCGVRYRLGSAITDGMPLDDILAVDSNVSFRCIAGKAKLAITKKDGI